MLKNFVYGFFVRWRLREVRVGNQSSIVGQIGINGINWSWKSKFKKKLIFVFWSISLQVSVWVSVSIISCNEKNSNKYLHFSKDIAQWLLHTVWWVTQRVWWRINWWVCVGCEWCVCTVCGVSKWCCCNWSD